MRRQPRSLVAVALGASLAFGCLLVAARAEAADEAVAVLGLESLDVGNTLGTQVTEALRRRASETQGIRVVPGKDLIEMKMVFGCDGEAPACLAQAGRSLGADKLIYGSIKKADAGRSVAIALKVLDVRDLAVVRQVSETMPKKALVPSRLPELAARWFGQLIVPPSTGALAVQTQPSDAQVLIDGVPAGRTPYKAKDLKPRTYAVQLQLDGYKTLTQNVDVHAGGTETLTVRLEREVRLEPPRPPPVAVVQEPARTLTSEPPRPRHPGRPATYAAIGLVSGAVVAGAVAIYTWRSYLKLEDSASAQVRGFAPSSGTLEQQQFYSQPKCQTPPGVSPDAARGYVSDCDRGNAFANATTGLWVAAGALATAGVISFIVGDRLDAKAERERRGTHASLRQSLRLLPAISTKGGGLQASFEF